MNASSLPLTPLTLSVWLTAVCVSCARPAPSESSPWHPCRVERISEPCQCADVDLPADDSGGRGSAVKLRVVKLPSHARRTVSEPVIFLAGGPGQSASAVAHHMLSAFATLRARHDLVFIDVRGTGGSQPLTCAMDTQDKGLSSAFVGALPRQKIEACARRYPKRDIASVHTQQLVSDLSRAVEKLGYERVNVVAVSYGTRLALRWMQINPHQVRAAVLDGVAPPEQVLFGSFAQDAQAAWDDLALQCRRQAGCVERFGDPSTLLKRVLDSVDTPQEVTATAPSTGQKVTLTMTRAGAAMAVRAILYQPQMTAGLLFALDEADQGRWTPLISLGSALSDTVSETMALGALLSVSCAEDRWRLLDERPARETFLGDAATGMLKSACDYWPVSRAPEGYAAPAPSQVPTLLMSGSLDPVTPPRWARVAQRSLPKGQVLVIPGAGHGTLHTSCGRRSLRRFLADPNAKVTPCRHQRGRPPIWLDALGPPG